MIINKLEWDSRFFGYPIGRIDVGQQTSLNLKMLNLYEYKLIYLFSEKELLDVDNKENPIQLVDIKVQLGKSVNPNAIINQHIVRIYSLSEQLIKLALQSGAYSRFKLDTHFKNNEFERLYTTWITNAIDDTSTVVYGYIYEGFLAGFITLSIKNNSADIGLIAVDEQKRGLQVGTKLLATADAFAVEQGIEKITVNTQFENKTAMNFYIKNNYNILNRSYIYHLWK
ncbi:MAG: GNAT family N-acetyltransferase [Bacteroidia bacterium]|jgi:dTDP-4-amino-4,6-dideoxy-D-galactose acyltransferase|nr:GNAT family N-acetyltransferase [Bacteroidia bacterium]